MLALPKLPKPSMYYSSSIMTTNFPIPKRLSKNYNLRFI